MDHNTGECAPYSLRTVCGFSNVPQNLYEQRLWDGAYGLSSLSENTKKYNLLQMYFQRRHFLHGYLKLVASRSADRRLSNWANLVAVNSETDRVDPGMWKLFFSANRILTLQLSNDFPDNKSLKLRAIIIRPKWKSNQDIPFKRRRIPCRPRTYSFP